MITNRNDDDHFLTDDDHFVEDLPEYIEPKKPAIGGLFDNPLNVSQLHKTPPPPRDYVLPSLPRGEVGALIAAGGVGKSMFILQCCYAITGDNHDFIGNCGQGAATYLSFEDSRATIAERAYNISRQMESLNLRSVEKNLHIHDLSTTPQNIIDNGELIDAITSLLISNKSRLCVIDTLSGIHKGDENSNPQMAALIGAFRRIAQGANCAVVFLHHMNKGSALNNLAEVQQASRGASSLTDNIRWQGYMSVMTEKEAEDYGVSVDERKMYVRFGISKINYGIPASDMWYQRNDFGVLYPAYLAKKIRYPSQQSNKPARSNQPKKDYNAEKNGGER